MFKKCTCEYGCLRIAILVGSMLVGTYFAGAEYGWWSRFLF